MQVIDWGLIEYSKALKKQKELVEQCLTSKEEFLIFCSHPPVVTLGRKSSEKDLIGWSGDVFSVERGGQATYHGPEQIIAYPIIDLNQRGRDLHKYLRHLESAIIETLKNYDLKAEGDRKDATGVWLGQKKIASIGIAAKKWLTYHGLALNLNQDKQAFQGISPCGFTSDVMTSLEEVLKRKIDRKEVQGVLSLELQKFLAK